MRKSKITLQRVIVFSKKKKRNSRNLLRFQKFNQSPLKRRKLNKKTMLKRIKLEVKITIAVTVVDMAVVVAVTTVITAVTVVVMVLLAALLDNKDKSLKVAMTRNLKEKSSHALNLSSVTRTRHSMQRTTKPSQPFEKLVLA